jgi:hypothetical protein
MYLLARRVGWRRWRCWMFTPTLRDSKNYHNLLIFNTSGILIYLIALLISTFLSISNLVVLLIFNRLPNRNSCKNRTYRWKSNVSLKCTCRCSLPKSGAYLGARLLLVELSQRDAAHAEGGTRIRRSWLKSLRSYWPSIHTVRIWLLDRLTQLQLRTCHRIN